LSRLPRRTRTALQASRASRGEAAIRPGLMHAHCPSRCCAVGSVDPLLHVRPAAAPMPADRADRRQRSVSGPGDRLWTEAQRARPRSQPPFPPRRVRRRSAGPPPIPAGRPGLRSSRCDATAPGSRRDAAVPGPPPRTPRDQPLPPPRPAGRPGAPVSSQRSAGQAADRAREADGPGSAWRRRPII
jgi:hypothetical protein